MNALSHAIELLGGQSALASAINGSPQLVNNWVRRGCFVPPEHCALVEQSTSGVVTRRDLRPDDWWLIWPELVTEEHPIPSDAEPASNDEHRSDRKAA